MGKSGIAFPNENSKNYNVKRMNPAEIILIDELLIMRHPIH